VTDEIRLTLPAQADFRHIANLVVGGLAARRDITFEHLEDLQVAFDTVLGIREDDDDITVTMCFEDGHVRAKVGPFDADALAQLDEGPGGLEPRRVLETVCDGVTVDGGYVELTKQVAE
jgi:hypothetical protein